MRIAIFSDTYAPEVNGVARTLKRYTDYLEEKGIEYRLFIPESGGSYPNVPEVHRFTSFPLMFYPECRLAVPNPTRIKEALGKFEPTLIHIATPFNLGLYGLHYGKKMGVPMVASYHTNFDEYLDFYNLSLFKKWVWKYLNWFHRPFEKIYAPSESTRNKLLAQNFYSPIEIWGRGVDHTMFTPLKATNKVRELYNIKEKNILLYVGRIAPEKEIMIAINTFHSLPEDIKNESHLLVVGEGPLFKSLTEDYHPQITFTGFMEGEALAEVYASSNLFLFPSATETFGNVVLEAMSSGLPVVGAKAGGVEHLINHRGNGLLCEPKNQKAFTEAVHYLLTNKTERENMGWQARQDAMTRSWDAIFDRLVTSCKQIAMTKRQMTA